MKNHYYVLFKTGKHRLGVRKLLNRARSTDVFFSLKRAADDTSGAVSH